MRLLFVINGLGTGGAERSLAEMLPLLRDAGVGATVATLYRRSEGVERDVVEAGFDVRLVRGRRTGARAAALRRILREQRPDLVHTTIFESNLAGRLAAAGTGIPVLTSLVNVLYSGGRLGDPNIRRWRLEAARRVDAWTARRLTAHFHAITHAVKRAAVETMGLRPDRITVIERGRDPARLGRPGPERSRRSRERLGIGGRTPVLVSLGRQDYQKGHRFLLEAAPRLLEGYPDLVVLVAGRKGNDSAHLEAEHARLGLDGRVLLLGHRPDAPELLAAGDVFVFPSLWEGLGASLIEAMALGLPIVASDLDPIREVVEEGGNAVLARPGDPASLAAAISAVIDAPERARAFARRSRELFETRYTVEVSTARMLDLYRRLTRRPASRV